MNYSAAALHAKDCLPAASVVATSPAVVVLTEMDGAWKERNHGRRLRALRQHAERLREKFVLGPRVLAVRTLPLTQLPYPTRYAFGGAARSPAPFVTLTHRCVLVQFLERGVLRHLLFNPSDIEASRATPFFQRFIRRMPRRLESVFATRYPPIELQLEQLGLLPGDIDYVAFDHFHTQDLRPIMGTEDGRTPPRFPNARLLAPKVEWDEWDELHPMQRDWFVRDGKSGVRKGRILFTDFDIALGDGVLLIRTPGHTIGNQTLFLNTTQGVWGISENGTSADNWSPCDSRISGLTSSCRRAGTDVILNSNTPESAVDQYASMIVERTLVDRVRRAPAFLQMFPSSEVTPSLIAPGLAPTLLHRAITAGDIVQPSRRSAPPPPAEPVRLDLGSRSGSVAANAGPR